MKTCLRKIEAVDAMPSEALAAAGKNSDLAVSEIGMIMAAGRVVFLPNRPLPKSLSETA